MVYGIWFVLELKEKSMESEINDYWNNFDCTNGLFDINYLITEGV